jgi:hypothetical protein
MTNQNPIIHVEGFTPGMCLRDAVFAVLAVWPKDRMTRCRIGQTLGGGLILQIDQDKGLMRADVGFTLGANGIAYPD